MSAAVVLSCSGLSKRYGTLMAVDDVDLVIRQGARHALIGPNGAGKSTLFSLLAGTLPPSSGTITLNGAEASRTSEITRSRRGLAKTFQHSSLFASLSVLDNVAIPAQRILGTSRSWWRRASAHQEVTDRAMSVLRDVGLHARAGDQVRELSHGERRQLEVAVALATEPTVLLLDEPTAGMSATESGRFAELIESLSPEISLVIIEHDLDIVFRLADEVTVLHLGKVLAEGSCEAVRDDDRVQQAYLGTAQREPLFIANQRGQ